MLRDRSSAPDTSVPFRPLYHVPARLVLVPIASGWHSPRRIRMYFRTQIQRNGTIENDFLDWSGASLGPFAGVGTVANSGETIAVTLELTGRVPPHVYRYTIRKTSSGGVNTDTQHTLAVTGPGSYSFSYSAPTGGTARMQLSGNQQQYNLYGDAD